MCVNNNSVQKIAVVERIRDANSEMRESEEASPGAELECETIEEIEGEQEESLEDAGDVLRGIVGQNRRPFQSRHDFLQGRLRQRGRRHFRFPRRRDRHGDRHVSVSVDRG